MNNEKLYNLNIIFKYSYFDKKLQKDLNYNYNILDKGKFSHIKIRNENFYDYLAENIEDKDSQNIDVINRLKEKCENSNNDLMLQLPFSNKYLSMDSLDKIIINETKDKTKNEELNFINLLGILESDKFKDEEYTSENIKDFFIDIINNLFNKGKKAPLISNRNELLKTIDEIKETNEVTIYNKIINKINELLKPEKSEEKKITLDQLDTLDKLNFKIISNILKKIPNNNLQI